jgi:hypothetical protein
MRQFDPSSGAVTSSAVFDLSVDPREIHPAVSESGPIDEVFSDAAGNRGLEFSATLEAPSPDLKELLNGLGYLGDAMESE